MIQIDEANCRNCGICGDVCPRHIPEIVINGADRKTIIASRERIQLCMSCGHCAAVCPTNSITVEGCEQKEFRKMEIHGINQSQLITLLSQRRSVRRYKHEQLPRDLLDKLVEAASVSPTATGSGSNGIIVINNRQLIEKISDHAFQMYDELNKALRNPIARFFLKRKIGNNTFRTLVDFVMPGMRWYSRWKKEGKGDEITRNSPALILFFGPPEEPLVKDNATIAAFHAILVAETLGISTCFNHLIPPVCNRVEKVRELINLPEGQAVYSSITLGFSDVSFIRRPPRKAASVHFLQ